MTADATASTATVFQIENIQPLSCLSKYISMYRLSSSTCGVVADLVACEGVTLNACAHAAMR